MNGAKDMKGWKIFVNKLELRFGADIAEKFLIGAALWWGLILLLPIETFSLSSAYRPMEMIMPEVMWGLCFLFLAFVHFLALTRDMKRLRGNVLLVSVILWVFVATMMLIGLPASTGSGIYVLTSYLSAMAYYNVKLGDS